MLILLGPPGSGKGTQAFLLHSLGFSHISPGIVLRKAAANDPELERILSSGLFVKTETVNKIVFDYIANEPKYILDGYPRTPDQAVDLCDFLKKVKGNNMPTVITLECSDDLLVKRLEERKSCSECGATFTKEFEKCTYCNAVLYKRSDDTKEIILKRLGEHDFLFKPILNVLLENKFKIHYVNANDSIQNINKNILKLFQA